MVWTGQETNRYKVIMQGHVEGSRDNRSIGQRYRAGKCGGVKRQQVYWSKISCREVWRGQETTGLLVKDILQGSVEGSRKRGRSVNITEWTEKNTIQAGQLTDGNLWADSSTVTRLATGCGTNNDYIVVEFI